MRRVIIGVGTVLIFLSGCSSVPLSKTDSALLGALGGAAVGAATHKHFKASAKDAAIYGAVAGGIIGYVAGSDAKSKHTVNARSCYDKQLAGGRVVHICEEWEQEDSERIK